MSSKDNVALFLAYDGTDFLGWQENAEGPSIEGTLRIALEQIQQHPVVLQAASRTDAGVHAAGQVVNFTTERLRKPLFQLVGSLNRLLPPAIRVLDAVIAPLDFHPTVDARGKEYHYSLCYGPFQLPVRRWTSWHYPYSLDVAAMRRAAAHLVGTHDFAAFCTHLPKQRYPDTVRTLWRFDIEEIQPQHLRFCISGSQFLYKMVRTLVGTLLPFGRRLQSPDAIAELLQASTRGRAYAGVTAPAHGLTLYRVFYNEFSACK